MASTSHEMPLRVNLRFSEEEESDEDEDDSSTESNSNDQNYNCQPNNQNNTRRYPVRNRKHLNRYGQNIYDS